MSTAVVRVRGAESKGCLSLYREKREKQTTKYKADDGKQGVALRLSSLTLRWSTPLAHGSE